MNPVGAFASAHVEEDHRIGIFPFQRSDKIIPDPLRLTEGMYFIVIIEGQSAIQGTICKIGIEAAIMPPTGYAHQVLLPFLGGLEPRRTGLIVLDIADIVRSNINDLLTYRSGKYPSFQNLHILFSLYHSLWHAIGLPVARRKLRFIFSSGNGDAISI